MSIRSCGRSASNRISRAAATRRLALDWRGIALALLVLLLAYQVIIPFVMIIWTSLKTARPGEPEFVSFTFTLANYVRAFGGWSFWSATWDTLALSVASTLVSFMLGVFVAWVVERTNTPLAQFIGIILIGRIVVPGILIVISWILIASPNIGILNQIVRNLTGIRNLFDIYSFPGMVWVESIEMVPLTYLLLSASFQAMDPRLEEASTMTGAGIWRTLRRILLPLALPATLAAMLLVFVFTIEAFEVPLLLGGRAGVRVYSTEIFYDTSQTPTDWGLSSTYAVAMLILCIVLLVIYFRLVRHSERYQTVTGKDFRPRRIDLGGWRYVTCGLALLLIFVITIVPLLTMIYTSLLTFYQVPSRAAFASMSLDNYRSLLSNSDSVTPMINSTLIGIGSASAVVFVVSLIAYFVHKTRLRGRRMLDFLGFAPIAIPSVILGATFLWFYLLVPIPVLGTLTIIGLAYLTKYMPFALRFVSASMIQIHPELDEAAQVAGIPWSRNFFKIMLPLLKPGLLAAWFWVMVHAYRELPVALMLARSQNRTAAVLIYDLWSEGSFLRLSALGVIMFAILIVLVSMSHSIGRRYGIKEQY